MKHFCLFLLLWITIGSSLSNAYDIKKSNQRIEKFVNAQGFYQNTVNAMASDRYGYLWVATPNGLIRYDGYSFEYHYNDPENSGTIPDNFVSSLLNDSEGTLWIGTKHGICLYYADKEQFFSIRNSSTNISLIKEDAQKRVWIASGTTLHILKSGSNVQDTVKTVGEIELDKALAGRSIVDIDFLSDSTLLVATVSKVYKVVLKNKDGFSAEVSAYHDDLTGLRIQKIVKIENSVWLATNKGLFQMFQESSRLITLRKYFNSSVDKLKMECNILTLFVDTQKKLWIGTTRNGILQYDSQNDEFISYQYDPKNEIGLSSSRINCLYEDEFGVLWIGTAQGGINKLDKNQKSFYNYVHNPYDDHTLSGNLINDIMEDRKGRIWVSTYENTLCRTHDKVNLEDGSNIRFERLEEKLGQLKDENVLSLFQDSKGYFWIGTFEGVYLYDDVNEKLFPIQIACGENAMAIRLNRVISQTGPHHILIGGTNVCLLRDPWESILSGKPVQTDRQLVEMANSLVLDFVLDGFGQYWFATRNGIFWVTLENEKLVVKKHLTTNTDSENLQLSHNDIFCIHDDTNKDIWVGTFGGGLMDIQLSPSGQPEKIRSFHKKDGLPDEAIYGILEDNDGIFWLSTDMGICKFDPVSERFDVFNVNDGIANYNFRQSAYLKTNSGIMMMGGLNGLTVFNPKELVTNTIPPRVLISKLRINNQPVLTGQKVNGQVVLENSISHLKKLKLSYVNRNVSFDILVKHTSAPKKNRLSYMLAGVNKDWIEVMEGKTTATYTNLSSGTYRFLYKGANGDGIWTEETEELIIRVLAPWYLRWWSILVWLFLILFIIYEIFGYLVRLEKLKQKLKFEQIDKERVHDMDQAKLRFFTNISHEFKTPLSLIIGPLEKIAEQNKRPENQRYFAIIQNNITRLQRLIEQLISYRKAETGYLELNYSKITLGNFIYPLLEAFEENAKRTNVNFFYKVYNADRVVVLDIDKTERILLNLFSNAVKFTGLDGNVSIEAGFETVEGSEMLYINVSDNGIGIQPEKIARIFDRFYRAVDEQENWDGTGIGLALCKSLVDLMKGTITVESVQNERTSFIVCLPFTQPDVVLTKEVSNRRSFVTDLLPAELEEVMELEAEPDRPVLLIIDDEVDVRMFLREAFQNKYNVVLAENGKDGLKKLEKNHVQLVICDVMMPKMDGFQVCENIKSNPNTCYIPVILLTALDETAKKMEGLESGADDYITKPFSIRHLELRVKKLIESKQRVIDYFSSSSVIPKDLSMPEKDRQFLEKISRSIEKNMSDSSFGVEELAKEVGMSTSHFFRRLKQLTGQVPNVYLRNFRLQKAAEILRANNELNAIEVMFEIGIESPSYFSTSFKKLHGVSPSEFIKKLKD
ncbi:two-component regulator propeller domain-containing protein [Mangrovibacterium sp.]|uniref:hybrid sensor histidine kinase/response regulator transcription factor n=1 Tax=Mangrovibacterium sp. TaxID=1961364 RepID=UPI003562F58F